MFGVTGVHSECKAAVCFPIMCKGTTCWMWQVYTVSAKELHVCVYVQKSDTFVFKRKGEICMFVLVWQVYIASAEKEERIMELEAEVEKIKEEVVQLKDRNAHLEHDNAQLRLNTEQLLKDLESVSKVRISE